MYHRALCDIQAHTRIRYGLNCERGWLMSTVSGSACQTCVYCPNPHETMAFVACFDQDPPPPPLRNNRRLVMGAGKGARHYIWTRGQGWGK